MWALPQESTHASDFESKKRDEEKVAASEHKVKSAMKKSEKGAEKVHFC